MAASLSFQEKVASSAYLCSLTQHPICFFHTYNFVYYYNFCNLCVKETNQMLSQRTKVGKGGYFRSSTLVSFKLRLKCEKQLAYREQERKSIPGTVNNSCKGPELTECDEELKEVTKGLCLCG